MVINLTALSVTLLPYQATHKFGKMPQWIVGPTRDPLLAPFAPNPDGILQASMQKSNFAIENRKVLTQVLKQQYQGLPTHPLVEQNIELLNSSQTFTITTGHQLCLAFGPAFVLYKIITAINTAERLNQQFPDKKFVPVFWMASEDHDLAELADVELFGRPINWQPPAPMPAGWLPTADLALLLEPFKLPEVFVSHYNGQTLAQATMRMANQLFGSYGLVVIDPNHAELKKLFTSVVHRELTYQFAEPLVAQSAPILDANGFDQQAFARPINLFWLEENSRTRIEYNNGAFYAGNQLLLNCPNRDPDVIQDWVNQFTHKFSPNVILRPLYQETILPNAAYIGGPAELAYWLQLYKVFEQAQVGFPVLMPRFSATVIPKKPASQWLDDGFLPADMFKPIKELKAQMLASIDQAPPNIDNVLYANGQLYQDLLLIALATDASLAGAVNALKTQTDQLLANFGKKLTKAAENRQATRMARIDGYIDKFLPQGKLQERTEGWASLSAQIPDLIAKVKDICNPFEYGHYLYFDE